FTSSSDSPRVNRGSSSEESLRSEDARIGVLAAALTSSSDSPRVNRGSSTEESLRFGRRIASTLAELEATARALLAVLLPLLDPSVPGEEARLLEPPAQLHVDRADHAGHAVPQRAGLGRHASPLQLGSNVELLVGLRDREGLLDQHLD